MSESFVESVLNGGAPSMLVIEEPETSAITSSSPNPPSSAPSLSSTSAFSSAAMGRGNKIRATSSSSTGYCPHGKKQSRCVDCGGKEMCEHGKRRTRCIDCREVCKGSELCLHNVRKSRCRVCGGSSYCMEEIDCIILTYLLSERAFITCFRRA